MMKSVLVTGIAVTAILGVWAGCGPSSSTGGPSSSSSGGPRGSSSSSSAVSSGSGGGGGAGGGSGGAAAIDIMCNPVTNAGCTTAGDSCDVLVMNGMVDGFQCYTGPNTVADCGSCDPMGQTAPFCSPGSTCFQVDSNGDGQCAHYCCTDADCGADGACAMVDSMNKPLFGPASTTLGVCVVAPGDGGAGDGGASDGGAASQFACDPPATSPSAGSCIMLTPGG